MQTGYTDKLCVHTPSVVHLIDNAGFLKQYPQKHLDSQVIDGLWWTIRTQANNPCISFRAQCSRTCRYIDIDMLRLKKAQPSKEKPQIGSSALFVRERDHRIGYLTTEQKHLLVSAYIL